MVHSFLTRFFSLVNSVKNAKSQSGAAITTSTRNATSVSLEAILENSTSTTASSPPSPAIIPIPNRSIAVEDYDDSSQVVRITKITKINMDGDSTEGSPTFYMADEKNNNQYQCNESDSDNKPCNNARWSSVHSWNLCGCTTKQQYSTSEDEEYDDDCLSDLEQHHCINSTKNLHGDRKISERSHEFHLRRRKCFLIAVGLIAALILSATITAIVLIVNSSTQTLTHEASLGSSHYDIDSRTSPDIINQVIHASASDSDETVEDDYSSNSSEYNFSSVTIKSTVESSTSSATAINNSEDAKSKEIERKRKISRLSWDLINKKGRHHRIPSNSRNSISDKIVQINRDDDDDEAEFVLPPKMVYTSSDYHLRRNPAAGDSDLSNNNLYSSSGSAALSNSATNKKNCCKTQRYSQVIKREGCESVTVVNRMCIGQCVSVWVPGLFASFPVCRPSRSVWRTVRLKCGQDGTRIQKVRVEKVKRCSCMQIEASEQNQYAADNRDINR